MKVTPRVKSNTIALAVFFVGFIIGFGVRDGQKPKVVYITPPPPDAAACQYPDISTDSIMVEVNDYRLSKGLPQLIDDLNLKLYADLRAQELADTKDLTHTSKYGNFATWSEKTGLTASSKFSLIYEDIASNEMNPCKTVQDFSQSPSHNATILDPNAYLIGVGLKDGYVVLEIGNK